MSNATRGRRAFTVGFIMLASSTLAGCVSTVMPREIKTQTVMRGERPVVLGSAVRSNLTPMEAPLACLAGSLNLARRRPLVIGVGEIKDYTGRYSINEGNVVTQGGALMLYSALAKLGGAIRVAERYDPAIGERELAYMDRRQLGDGKPQQVDGKTVPWVPYFGGSIQGSDYYIVGGITEANANISSGGAEVAVNNIGVKRRTFTQSVAIDLRIVDSRSLLVVDAVSLQKQYTGYEVGANTFRFFGLDLFDVTIGAKAQEPMQLGIRATIEEAAMLLVGRVNQLDVKPCLELVGTRLPKATAEQLLSEAASGKMPAIAAAAARSAGIAKDTPATAARAPRPAPPAPLARAKPPVSAQLPVRELPPVAELPPVKAAPPIRAQIAVTPPLPLRPPMPIKAPAPALAPVPALASVRAPAPAQPPMPIKAPAPAPALASARPPAPAQPPMPIKSPAPAPALASARPPVPTKPPMLAQAPIRAMTATVEKPAVASAAAQPTPSDNKPLNQIAALGETNSTEVLVLTYEVGEVHLPGTAIALLDRIVTLARKDGVTVALTTRDNESAFPAQRTRMLDARITDFLIALANRGIASDAIRIVWRPDSTDSTIYRQGAGLQALARIKIRS